MDARDPETGDWSLDLTGNGWRPGSRSQGKSGPHPGGWTDATGLGGCASRSFAREARMRLDFLKLGSTCQVSSAGKDATGDAKEKEPGRRTVLDLVELLQLHDDAEDDESWLYEAPKRRTSADGSPLRWCRRVLDNPSPETEAASPLLADKLNQESRSSYTSDFSRQPAVQDAADGASLDPCDGRTTRENSDIFAGSRRDRISVPERKSLEPQVGLRQQVSQLKLLKIQPGPSPPCGPASVPLRALRNSRSLDTDDGVTAHQTPAADLPSGSEETIKTAARRGSLSLASGLTGPITSIGITPMCPPALLFQIHESHRTIW
ncbi:uncharacterized protein LOC133491876 [Syngnathoides biaculeatus]|uniref:uncharacterized protein LOC133491876 n=1 Tax=Syngnathoides biaculeatus TaxID=300417 RepID=UPI002ADE0CEB|nr:uncharacterized protein LOC133491876 [Syngnathoides biaculeatus]